MRCFRLAKPVRRAIGAKPLRGNPAARVESGTPAANRNRIMKTIVTLALAVAALTLAACSSKTSSAPPPPVDMGHRGSK